ncbi:MAG TPA: decarboxylating 6-phosphogluconate dehydrogenase [Eubacteriaceae bacterium]|nr:decarboxylating 6-phosphogluconate dehydrogenase [Eubacteriaceae bacterium]
MKIGIIGLGKMGTPLALNLKDQGFEPIAYNRSKEKVDNIQKEGVRGAYTLRELFDQLDEQKILWMMLPAGEAVDTMLLQLEEYLKEDDIVIDGGNSNYKDTQRRYAALQKKGIHLIDVGTSGGIEGARNGACMMVGGNSSSVGLLEDAFSKVCVPGGYAHVGPSGAGHYVKMVHNGIEYGMMQAMGEGFDLLQASEYDIDYTQVAHLWQHGSVIRSWLMELAEAVFEKYPSLESLEDVVQSSGEGLWTVEEGLRLKVPLPVITDALYARYDSQRKERFSNKLLAGLRNEFGGHPMKTKDSSNK